MLHGEKSYTKSGNMQAPSMEVYLKWIIDAWDQLSKDLIIKLFKGCRLANNLDGSEDCKIHCFRSDDPIQTGQELFKQARNNAYINGTRKLIQQLDINAESNENDKDSHASVDFYQ